MTSQHGRGSPSQAAAPPAIDARYSFDFSKIRIFADVPSQESPDAGHMKSFVDESRISIQRDVDETERHDESGVGRSEEDPTSRDTPEMQAERARQAEQRRLQIAAEDKPLEKTFVDHLAESVLAGGVTGAITGGLGKAGLIRVLQSGAEDLPAAEFGRIPLIGKYMGKPLPPPPPAGARGAVKGFGMGAAAAGLGDAVKPWKGPYWMLQDSEREWQQQRPSDAEKQRQADAALAQNEPLALPNQSMAPADEAGGMTGVSGGYGYSGADVTSDGRAVGGDPQGYEIQPEGDALRQREEERKE